MSNNNQNKGDNASFAAVLGVTLSAIGAGAFYSAWRDNLFITAIKNTPYTSLDKVNTSSGPIYVKITGKSGSDERLKSDISKKDACIYQRTTFGVWYAPFSKSGNPNNQWIQEKFRTEPPWYIHDGMGHKAYLKSFDAENPPLEEVHVHEEKGGNFFLSFMMGTVGIKYPYKYVVKEHIFPPNRDVLVLGNAYRTPDGAIKVTQPWEGFKSLFVPHQPAIITNKSEEEFVNDLKGTARTKTIVASVLGSLGVLSLVGGVWRL